MTIDWLFVAASALALGAVVLLLGAFAVMVYLPLREHAP